MRYRTTKIHVDIDTGELISPWECKENYTIIKKEKNVKIDKKAFWGIITITYECRKNTHKQGDLFDIER